MYPNQQPYYQGLVPVLQQMPMAQPMQQVGVTNTPNAGQQQYLASLQDQIKASQQATADNMKGYEQSVQDATAAAAAKKKDSGGGFWGALGGIVAKAIPFIAAAV